MSPRAADVMTAEFTGADQGQIIAPGATIGVMGGGQLGRMTALAAARLGYRLPCVLPGRRFAGVAGDQRSRPWPPMTTRRRCSALPTPSMSSPSNSRTSPTARRSSWPRGGRRGRSRSCCISASSGCGRRISWRSIGVPVTRYLPVPSRQALDEAVRRLGLPAILKSAQFGYDGKGQVRLTADTNLDEAWASAWAGRWAF